MPFQVLRNNRVIQGLNGGPTLRDLEDAYSRALLFAGIELAQRKEHNDPKLKGLNIPVTKAGWAKAATKRPDGGIDLLVGDMLYEIRYTDEAPTNDFLTEDDSADGALVLNPPGDI